MLQHTTARIIMGTSPLIESISRSLDHWQFLYILAITIALLSTFAIVVFAFHVQEHKVGLKVSNYIYVIASLLAVLATIVIVTKTKSLDAEKDRVAGVQSAQANQGAADANKKAQVAYDDAEKVKAENLKLQGNVASESTRAGSAEAGLAKANKETSDFAHSLQQQQATMQEQAKVSPVLSPIQVAVLTNVLKGFSGQDVEMHSTTDTTVLRLKYGIDMAFKQAGITESQNMMEMGALYQGVTVAVHSATNVPPFANILAEALHVSGIDVHTAAVPERVPEGKVAIFLGPN
jgi:hypothetical protein